MLDAHNLLDDATRIIAICSVLHTLMPPWEVLNDFPLAQKYYKVVVYTIGYASLAGRSTVYKSLSTKDGAQTSKASENNPNT
jgi:hypothetical protein